MQWGLALLLTALAALPLAAAETLPLFDYPNHLARVHVLANLEAAAGFQTWFEADTLLLPNILTDLVLLVLLPWVGVETAGRLLLFAILALTIGGAVALGNAATGRRTLWPLLAAALVWHETLIWGFLNYELGVALLPWALAVWLRLEGRSRGGQLTAAAVAAIVLFFSHLVAAGLFAVGIAVLELARAWRCRFQGLGALLPRLLGSAAVFLPVLALYLSVSPTGGLPFDPRFSFTAWQKLSPFARLFSSGNETIDTVTLVGVVGLWLVGWWSGRLHKGLSLVAAAFLALVLSLPYSALGSFFLDSRIAIAVALVLVATPVAARPPARMAIPFVLGLVLLVGGRSMALAADWRDLDHDWRQVKATLDRLPRGAVLVPADAAPFELGDWRQTRRTRPGYEHAAGYAAIRRDAVVTNLFARRGQNPLVFAPPHPDLAGLGANPIARAGTGAELEAFLARVAAARVLLAGASPEPAGLFVILFHRTCNDLPATAPDGARLTPVGCAADHALLRVGPPPDPPPNRDGEEIWADGPESARAWGRGA